MKTLLLILLFVGPVVSKANPKPAELQYSLEFIFSKVLEMKDQAYRPEIPLPTYHFESKTPLRIFQDAIEAQWGMRPEKFSNAFAIKSNQIFILDEAAYYERTNRCMDDSVVHELVHYIQSKYQGWDMNDESLEWQAIDIQTAFREQFCHQ